MPLKLIPPRNGKTPFWYVRGTYLGQFVDRSTKTDRKAVARKFIEKWQREIERGEFTVESEATFLSAAFEAPRPREASASADRTLRGEAPSPDRPSRN